MNTVNIIAAHDVLNHLADIVAIGSDARIQDAQTVVGEHALGMGHGNMIAGKNRCPLGAGTIGIEPGVQLHTALVALLHHPLQRVPIRRRCLPLHTRQETAPRLVFACVERITLGTHLEDDSVDAVLLQLVELPRQFLLHANSPLALELTVNTLNPRPAELALRRTLGNVVGTFRCTRGKQGSQHESK